MIRNGGVLTMHQENGNTLEFPGAPTEELWLGLSFGEATQATDGSTNVIGFRPVIFFQRQLSGQNPRASSPSRAISITSVSTRSRRSMASHFPR